MVTYDETDTVWTTVTFATGPAQASRSSNAYGSASNLLACWVQWDAMFPDLPVTELEIHARVDANGDQVDVRLWNNDDSETALEVTGLTGNRERVLGPQTYTPTTTDDPVPFRVQFRNSDNTTSVDVSDVTTIMRVKTA